MEMVLYTRHGVLSYMTEIPVMFQGEQCMFIPDRRDSSTGIVVAFPDDVDCDTVAGVYGGTVHQYGMLLGTLEELKEGKL